MTDSIIDLGESAEENSATELCDSEKVEKSDLEAVRKGKQGNDVKFEAYPDLETAKPENFSPERKGRHGPRRKHGKPGRDFNTVESYMEFSAGWVKRFEKLLARENIFNVMFQAKKRCQNLINRCPKGKGNR